VIPRGSFREVVRSVCRKCGTICAARTAFISVSHGSDFIYLTSTNAVGHGWLQLLSNLFRTFKRYF